MKLKDFPLDQKIEFIRALMSAVHQCQESYNSYMDGSIEEYEYQPDTHWHEAYGIKKALVIMCGEDECAKLSLFLGNFNDITEEPECYSDDEVLSILLDAFGVEEYEYNPCGY